MVQRPNAVGLTLCQLVIVEESTKNVTLANSFQTLDVETFPSASIPFAVYTVLTDGLGEIKLDLAVLRGDTLDEIYTRSFKVTFTDPLRQLRLWWNVRSCSFPAPGRYEFGLQANRELMTQSVLEVREKGSNDD
jgi:hypothetical protein